MSQKTEHVMKKISIGKVVLNIGVGKSGEPIDQAKGALSQILDKKPSARAAKSAQRDWGVHKGEPIGVVLTIRGNDAVSLLKRLFEAKGNQIKDSSFDNFGNLSFGIIEHIDIPGVKYNPKIGILGLDVAIALQRPGFNIRFKSKQRSKIGKLHRISKEDAKEFLIREFGIEVS